MSEPVEQLFAEVPKGIASALVKAQTMMHHASLDGKNPHFKSKYSTLQSVIDAVKPSLNENGIAFLQRAQPAEGGVNVETIFVHESGETLSGGVVYVPTDKFNAHGTGSAYTYAKRYGLAMACGIGADEDDDGNQAAANPPKAGAMAATMEHVQADPSKVEAMAIHIDECFTLEGEGRNAVLECVDREALGELIEALKGDSDLKIAVWNELGSKVRAYIKKFEKGDV